ncbi:MAG: chromosome segregation protein [Actinomycetota bacterium]|nr:chromosome segregation protein [Actinomycetota bacterium]
MFLKRLTVKGFKSFADRTTLDFEPGVAVVVGPNGSGKSNVVDAVAWVLGAQGARSLRGGKMEDVIFAGTPKRPAAGKAEVSLTLDNGAGMIPVASREVTITRSLTRDGESGYAINGDPCRLLDITELLSHTGMGRTQHVIVGQGRLDAILQARPEDRRAVIEEAAGILKYRQRKEKAERRLEATAVNLERLGDLVKEVRRHLKPLERQADAARRHGGLTEELRAIRLHLAGREITTLTGRLASLGERRERFGAEESVAREQAATLEASVAESEAALSDLPADSLGDAVASAESLLARARGLGALVAEKRRNVDRSLAALADAGVVETLTAEAAKLRVDLARADEESAALAPCQAEIEAIEETLAERRAELDPGGDLPARKAAAETRAELTALAGAVARTEAEQTRLEGRREPIRRRLARVAEEETAAGVEEFDEAPLVAALESARLAREAAEQQAASAEEARRAADGDTHRWAARADALDAALGDLRAGLTAALDGVDGLLGPAIDLITIEPGCESAVAAALGEALRGVVARDAEAARAALTRLRSTNTAGTVLVPVPVPATAGNEPAFDFRSIPVDERRLAAPAGRDEPASDFRSIPVDERRLAPPDGARPLAGCVGSSVSGLGDVLNRLLSGTVVVDGTWEQALSVALANPDLVVVTPDGDRLDGRGAWHAGGTAIGATPAAAEEAHRRAAEAAEARERAETALGEARTAMDEARRWEAAGDKALDSHRARQAAVAAAATRVQTERAEAEAEAAALEEHAAALAAQAEAEGQRRRTLEAALPALEEAEDDERRQESARRAAAEALDAETRALAATRREHDLRVAAVEERRRGLGRRLVEVEARLVRHGEARQQAEERRGALASRGDAYAAIDRAIQERIEILAGMHGRLREQRRERSEAARAAAARLDALRRERATAERAVGDARERRARVEIEEAEVRTKLDAAVESCRRDLECEPEVALAAPAPACPEGASLAARGKEIERELRLMGAINPLALEEYEAQKERYALLESQLEDVKAARRDLAQIIKQVNQEIATLFAGAYEDTERHFAALIATLFPGGSGRLRLTDAEDPLNTGIEIEARPSGKNVRRLSLLSGGERSLTALAFLFAVFRARPTPFYILDEVEAALDDVNLCRFVDLIHAFRDEAQLLVVSHQKRTMEAADCLYGVSMPPGGSSIVVTQRVPSSEPAPVAV